MPYVRMLVCRCWGLPKSYFGQGQITFGPVLGLVHKMQTRAPPKPGFWHWEITFGQVSLSLRMQTRAPQNLFSALEKTFGQVLGWFASQGAESVQMSLFLEGAVLGAAKKHLGRCWLAGRRAERVQMSLFLEKAPKPVLGTGK